MSWMNVSMQLNVGMTDQGKKSLMNVGMRLNVGQDFCALEYPGKRTVLKVSPALSRAFLKCRA